MSRRRSDDGGPSGFAVVDKEAGWTSHDVVAKARGILGTRKVGHSGTLDPGATGVLVLGVGKGTRLLRFVTALEKEYVAEAVLGVETDTLDADGVVTATHDMSGVSIDDVAAAASAFVGDIEQIPPMVSAVKVDGKRLHELAREGKEVERSPRRVTVYSLDVDAVPGEPDVFSFRTRCSSGTYVRTLAADIAASLGGGAHLRSLRRTSIGSHSAADAMALDQVTLIGLADGLVDYPAVTIDDDTAARVRNGQRLSPDDFNGDGPWRVVDAAGGLVAMFERVDGRVRSAVVIPAD